MTHPGVCVHGGLRRQCEACDLAERLEALLALLPANLDDIAGGLADFLGHSGPLHDDDCPCDDTCSCSYYRENCAANEAARLLDRLAEWREALSGRSYGCGAT